MFDEFSARITLHRAHLAHSLGKSAQASSYYTIASALSEPNSFVGVAATLGRIGLLVGLSPESPAHEGREGAMTLSLPVNTNSEHSALGSRAARLTKGMGATLEAAGKVIQAATSTEILRAKWDSLLCLF